MLRNLLINTGQYLGKDKFPNSLSLVVNNSLVSDFQTKANLLNDSFA